MIEAQCKKCRRQGEKLFLKGERCFTVKCSMIKRPFAPGVKGKNVRRTNSEYSRQLAEKQKVKRIFGLRENQFAKYIKNAIDVKKGDKKDYLISKLLMRLDNVAFLIGIAHSRRMARQIVNHGHVLVNGKKVDIPSYQVKIGQVISLKDKIKKSTTMEAIKAKVKKSKQFSWLEVDNANLSAKIIAIPTSDDFDITVDMQQVMEFYSR